MIAGIGYALVPLDVAASTGSTSSSAGTSDRTAFTSHEKVRDVVFVSIVRTEICP